MTANNQSKVILLSESPAVREAAAKALGKSHKLTLVAICGDSKELCRQLNKTCSPAVLVDLGDNPAGRLNDLGGVIPKFSAARFVMLANNAGNDLVFKSMEIGARYYLLKESMEAELVSVLERLASSDGKRQSESLGEIITLLSAGGGCGATTIAVNMANELSQCSQDPALIVDVDESYGSITTYLGIQGLYGLADVLSYEGNIDPELIRSSAAVFSEKLHALLSPISISSSNPSPLKYDHLESALQACRGAYRYTIIDSPRVSPHIAFELARKSAKTLIIFQLNVKDICRAKTIYSSLSDSGINTDDIMLVLSRYHKRTTMIDLDEVKNAFGRKNIDWISNDFRSAIHGLNYGRPLSEAAPRSVLRKDIQQLVSKIKTPHIQDKAK